MKQGVFIAKFLKVSLLVLTCFIWGAIINADTIAGTVIDGGGTSGSGSNNLATSETTCTIQEAKDKNTECEKNCKTDECKKECKNKYSVAVFNRNFKHCGDYGGISWHIFKLEPLQRLMNENNLSGGTYWEGTRYKNNIRYDNIKRSIDNYGVRLFYRDKESTYKEAITRCTNENADYLITLVYDGFYNIEKTRTGYNVGAKDAYNSKFKPVYYGPLGWKTAKITNTSPVRYPIYNTQNYNNNGQTKDTRTYSTITSQLKKGTNVDGWQLKGSCTELDNYKGCKSGTYKSTAADSFYKQWMQGTTKVPAGEGWFCLPSKVYQLFSGLSQVISTSTSSTGYIPDPTKNNRTSETVYNYIDCPLSGCKATFEHYGRVHDSGYGGSDYIISRSSNFSYNDIIKKGINSNSNLQQGVFYSNDRIRTETLTLYPGMAVCESMNFKVDNQGTRATTTVCAIANGSVPTGVDIKVKNNDVLAFKEYAKEVYAKPDNTVEFQATYDPILQYTTEIRPWSMQIDGGNWISNPTGEKLQILFNNRGNKPAWKNAFSISSANFQKDPFNQDYFHPKGVGNTEKYTPSSNTHQVQFGEVGISSPSEEAKVNDTTGTQTTPTQVKFSGANVANVITTPPIKSTANVWVPYNFNNTTKITDDPETKPLYAGEQESINFGVTVGRKRNFLFGDYYATRVDGAKKKLEIYVNGTRYETTEVSMGTINNDPTCLERDCTYPTNSREGYELKFNVPDVPAGTKVCLRSMVWPKHSGLDTNVKIEGYSPDWAVSDQKCFTVAKKPSIQLWGGNVYSAGNITTSVAKKSLLAGHNFFRNDYKPDPTDPQWVFGSFGELGLIATGRVEGLASGASTGYASYNHTNTNADDYGLWPNTHPSNGRGNINGSRDSGGSKTTNFCKHSPLSFANDKCPGSVGNLSSNNNLTKATTDKQKIINNLAVPSDRLDQKYLATDGFTINGKEDSHITSNGSYYYYSSENLDFAGGTIGKRTTQMVHSKEDITITGNVYYDTSERYSKLHDIPNLIIYAEGNITIDCGVAQLDALIIAEKSVNTCDSGDINADVNSNQLVINGAVVAGKLIANRTYGAGIGNNSIIPAEIINFNPALYLWNATNVDEDKNENKNEIKDLDTVKLTEVAPRY